MFRRLINVSVMVGVALCAQPVVQAQAAKESESKTDSVKRLWNPDRMMGEACNNISRHYGLDDEQKSFTCGLLTERVTKFLTKHNKKIWPLLMELTEMQMSGSSPDSETAKRIDAEGYDIFVDAKNEIMRAQDEFREILTEDQKLIHDRDLKGLEYWNNLIDQRFQGWRKGDTSGDSPLFNVRPGGGPKLTQPQKLTSPYVSRVPREDKWHKYVEDFVRDYRLNEAQKKNALSILKNLKDQATGYRKSNAGDLLEAARLLREAKNARPLNTQDISTATDINDQLHKPIEDLFNDLKVRLDGIPTEAQKADFCKRLPKRCAKGREVKKSGTTPVPPASQPATGTPKGAKPKSSAKPKGAPSKPKPRDPASPRPDADKKPDQGKSDK